MAMSNNVPGHLERLRCVVGHLQPSSDEAALADMHGARRRPAATLCAASGGNVLNGALLP
jgi:hypothetical protein